MSTYKSVFDIMAGASRGRFLREQEPGLESVEGIEYYDGEKAEFDTISLFERNVLAGFRMPDNFTISEGIEIGLGVNSVSTGKSQGGVQHLSHSKQVKLRPFECRDWRLLAEAGSVAYSLHTGGSISEDRGLLASVYSMCNNMSDSESDSLPIGLITEKIVEPGDMRHLFCKGYLMLQDLNVGAMFKIEEREYNPHMISVFYQDMDNARKLSLIAHRSVVVDAEGFTGEELEILSLMAQAYPPVRFGGHNIYNSCQMEADSVAIVSSKAISRSARIVPTPLQFYRALVSIAVKLNCTGDMEIAFKTIRGRCAHMADVTKMVSGRAVYSGICKSRNMVRALGGSTRFNTVVSSYPSYLSTSVGLVGDMLIGHGYEVAASMVVEHLGGMGKLICMDRPDTSRTYQGILRDFGLSNTQPSINWLCLEWTEISGVPYIWQMPMGWKDYIVSLSVKMWNGGDIPYTSLTYDIPFLHSKRSAWGVSRRWHGDGGAGVNSMADVGPGAKARKDERLRVTASFLWAMGVKATRPKVFLNAYSAKEVSIQADEYQWLAGAYGEYQLSHISYVLDGYGGREDELEETGTNIIRTTIDGTKCNIVYGVEGQWEVVEYRAEDVAGIVEDLTGVKPEAQTHTDQDIERVAMETQKPTQVEPTMYDTVKAIFTRDRVPIRGGKRAMPRHLYGLEKRSSALTAVADNMTKMGVDVHPGHIRRLRNNFDGLYSGPKEPGHLARILNDAEISLMVYNNEGHATKYGSTDQSIEVGYEDGNWFSVTEGNVGIVKTEDAIPPDSGVEADRKEWYKYMV